MKGDIMAKIAFNGEIMNKLSFGALESLWDEGVLTAPDAYSVQGQNDVWKGHLRDANEEYLVRKAIEKGLLVGEVCLLDFDDLSTAMLLRSNELRNSNLIIWEGGWAEMPSSRAKEIFDRGARAIGFAAALKEGGYPALSAFARKGVSIRPEAANSTPAGIWLSWLHLVEMTKCWNPGKLERALWAAREAFNVKFPSAGGKVSWQVLGRALATVGLRSPGKAAIVARAIQLGLPWATWNKPLYREARDFLIASLRGEKITVGEEEVLLINVRGSLKNEYGRELTLYRVMVKNKLGRNVFDQVAFDHWTKKFILVGWECTQLESWVKKSIFKIVVNATAKGEDAA